MNGTTSPNKWALLIGINEYPKLPQNQLHGCINDVDAMNDLLCNRFGFTNVVPPLKNEAATRDAILAAMEKLVAGVKQDDIVVVHYSGHGSQMTDRENDEPDELDETIVPYDSGRDPDPNRDITDDEIYAWLLRLSKITPFITFIFDCCHSGTITRDVFGETARTLPPDRRPISQLPPSPVAADIAKESARDVGASGWLRIGQRYVLIAGCQDDESSYEYEARQGNETLKHGTLTYFLCQELARVGQGTVTYRDVFERASSAVTAAQTRQHPQMEGARNRELFGMKDVPPASFVAVTRSGDKATLKAGAAHGMTVGSIWGIYPSGTPAPKDEARLAQVEISVVRAVTSDAVIKNEVNPGAFAAGARAFEEQHFYGDMRLSVDIAAGAGHEQAVSDLADLVAKSPLLRRATAREKVDARVYLLPQRSKVGKGDPVPQLKQLASPTWAVVGQDGRLMTPIHRVDRADAVLDVRDNLEKAARYRNALALRNANNDSPLKDKVDLILLKRQGQNGAWAPAEPDIKSGHIEYTEGERIAFEIKNNHFAPIFVSVLDFGLTGGISLLHPIEGASEQLLPGKSIQVGVRAGDEIELFMPENFPYVPEEDKKVAAGLEVFKLLAATREADFSSLAQESFRDIDRKEAKGLESPLGQLLDLALTGQGTRDSKRNRLPPSEDWTTVERSFMLKRKAA